VTVGSLFAGIGGFDLGFERAGFELRWQVEIDPFCLAVLAKHWPDVRRYDDVRTVGAHNLERVDVLCGGFPCQDISLAGKGAGLAGERSGLWSEYLRLICELRPDYVVVENVSALLGRGMGRVLGDLAACGFDAEWDCLPASAFGAPHRRDRVWIVAYSNCRRQQEREKFHGAAVQYSTDRYSSGPHVDGLRDDVADAKVERLERRVFSRQKGETFARPWESGGAVCDVWRAEPDVGRVAHGIPARVDRLRGLGNAVVPQITEWIARRILETEVIA
jgi:DNA (cytosine-5)-methyltransferase 1